MSIIEFRGEYFFLSNFYETPVSYGGATYPSSECAYQATKCENEEDKIQFRSVKPGTAKRLGYEVKLRKDWEFVKDNVMLDVLRAKFTQNVNLRIWLLRTGDEPIIEGNMWGDRYWGVCDGKGQNKLDLILMLIRAELREQ